MVRQWLKEVAAGMKRVNAFYFEVISSTYPHVEKMFKLVHEGDYFVTYEFSLVHEPSPSTGPGWYSTEWVRGADYDSVEDFLAEWSQMESNAGSYSDSDSTDDSKEGEASSLVI